MPGEPHDTRRRPGDGPARVEDLALLTGRGQFLDDLSPLPGSLTAAIVRSPHAHARIRRADLTAARAAPGVVAVIGPDEVAAGLKPFPLSVRTPMPYYPAATDKARFTGEPVAVVVAADRYVAEDAAELVEIDYEPLPAITTAAGALAGGAPLLHEGADGNVATDRVFDFGDFGAAAAAADRVITRDFSFPRYSSMPMECYSVIADWREAGDGPEVTAWANFHGPFAMVPVMAGALGVPLSRFRLIVPPDIGGSFGIKAGIYPYVVLLALASRHAGRPVRWSEDRLEHLLASSAGAGREMTLSAAVDSGARITALSADLTDDVGAYLRPPEPSTLYRCFGNITGAYRIPVVRIRARAVVTNTMPTGLNRGFGGQQLYFGLERLVDEIAEQYCLDPAEVRRRNLIAASEFPYRTPSGGRYDSGDYHAVLEEALAAAGYDKIRDSQHDNSNKRSNPHPPSFHSSDKSNKRPALRGIGIATIVDPSATNIGYVGLATPAEERARSRGKSGSTEHVRISFDPQGVVTVLLGSMPQGQGHATVARDIVAARLGLPPGQVRPRVEMDTASTPWTITSGSYSSRFAPLVTSALVDAADQIAATIKTAAGVLLGVAPDTLELAEGMVRVCGDPERAVAFRHAAGLVHWDPGSLPPGVQARSYAEAAFTPPESTAASADDQINSSLCYGFVAEVVAVEIDPVTLNVRIENVTSVHDAGTVLNHTLLEGQVHGALVHALGGALYEEMRYDGDGQPRFGTFLDYLCPTAAEADFPLTSLVLETPSPVTRLGAKGSGEGSSMSFPVAVANAVADALKPLGIKVLSLPLTPDRLHDLMEGTS
jgi:2-furoyl-CoA dehydrogenase large subunit